MREAVALMHRVTPDALSMRELARRLGVTYGAPHHHFPEKDDLFAAVAEEAFADLTVYVQTRALEVGDVEHAERLRVVARAYLAFATQEHVRYRVMFLPQLRDRRRFGSLHETGGKALGMLAAAFEAAGTPSAFARARAVACWATLHGFAVLRNDGFLEERGQELAELVEAVAVTAAHVT